jgi:flagellar assembly protein FliH
LSLRKERKILQYKNRIIKNEDAISFEMPSLDTVDKEDTNHYSEETLSSKKDIEVIEREAYEKGFRIGEKSGFAIGEEKAKILIDKLENALKEIAHLRERIIRELELEILELSVSIAKKILTEELKLAPEHIVEMTKKALARIERKGQITIKINPALYELFMKHRPEIVSIHPDVVFDTDCTLSECGSIVMGPCEDVVTDIDEQLRNLIREMIMRDDIN